MSIVRIESYRWGSRSDLQSYVTTRTLHKESCRFVAAANPLRATRLDAEVARRLVRELSEQDLGGETRLCRVCRPTVIDCQ